MGHEGGGEGRELGFGCGMGLHLNGDLLPNLVQAGHEPGPSLEGALWEFIAPGEIQVLHGRDEGLGAFLEHKLGGVELGVLLPSPDSLP